jgi:hypothetical protein
MKLKSEIGNPPKMFRNKTTSQSADCCCNEVATALAVCQQDFFQTSFGQSPRKKVMLRILKVLQ